MKKICLFISLLILTIIILSNDCLSNPNSQSQIMTDSTLIPLTPEMLNISNMGTDFWFSIPPVFYNESGGCDNYIKIYVISPYSTIVKTEIPGKGYSKSLTTTANTVSEFSIDPKTGQAFIKDGYDSMPPEQIHTGAGIHVYSNDPIVCYVLCRYCSSSDGFLAIPTKLLGKEYIATPYEEDPMFYSVWGYHLPGMIAITAPYAGTQVKVIIGGNANTVTGGGLGVEQSTFFNLQQGDVYIIGNKNAGGDLTGTKIIATKPLSVVSGNQCANIPVGNQWCDYTVEEDLPTYSWGKYCITPSIPGRSYSPYIRILAKEANTTIYRNGAQIAVLSTSGGLLNKGWFEMRLVPEDWGNKSAIISGDKPIATILCMTGSSEDMNVYGTSHDVSTMDIIPLNQFQKNILFCSPGTTGGMQFSTNCLNVVYPIDNNGAMPDDMMFGAVSSNSISWQKLKEAFPGVDELFAQQINGQTYAVKKITTMPPIGVFTITASERFAAYSYGYGSCDSYAYPTGTVFIADTKSNSDTIPPVVTFITPDSINNPKINAYVYGTVDDDPYKTGTQSNLNSIIMLSDSSYNYTLTHGDFVPGTDDSTWWSINVNDITSKAKATLLFSDKAGNYTTVYIYYTPGAAPSIDTIPPNVTWTMDSCNGIIKGKAIDMPPYSSVRANLAYIKVNSLLNYRFNYNPITIGKTDSISWSLTTIYPQFDAEANLTFYDNAGNKTNVSYIYYARKDSIIAYSNASFDSLISGNIIDKIYSLYNYSNSNRTINDIVLKYNNKGFSITNKPNLPISLYKKIYTNFTISFNATQLGTFIDSIGVVDNCGTKYLYKLVANVDSVITSVDNSTEQMNSFKVYQTQNSNEISISYQLAEPTNINISIYDINGNKLYDIVNNELNSNGLHEINYDVSKLITGTYFIRFSDSKNNYSRKISILK